LEWKGEEWKNHRDAEGFIRNAGIEEARWGENENWKMQNLKWKLSQCIERGGRAEIDVGD
jgi:hypothetical protein